MKSRIYLRAGVIFLMGVLAGCSPLVSGPSGVARQYLEDGVRGGNVEMESLFTQRRVREAGVKNIRDLTSAMYINFSKVTSIKMASERITGDTAVVDAEVSQDIEERPTTFTFTLVNEGGGWKIDQINFGQYPLL